VKQGTRKAQVLLSAEQYQLVEDYAREQGQAVSAILRAALERTLLASLDRRRREAALRRLCQQELPVSDWEAMEQAIEGMWVGHAPQ
jgi:hypothetical protein